MNRFVLFVALLTASPVSGSTLFEEDSVLDVTLRGPLSTVIADKRDRAEQAFSLSLNGTTYSVAIRIRGNSRVRACPFPPLRLSFRESSLGGTDLDGERTLKLVTHCRNGSERSQDSVLNEYAAYRVFQLISANSYRVRLLSIRYEDTDGKQARLQGPHYGFLIESDRSLAKRLGGTVAEVEAIRFADLDNRQTALVSIFQYFIGNNDWSLVTSENDDVCCHNIDLLRLGDKLVPIPYDFDLAALTRANYRMAGRMNVSKRREYSGYCRVSTDSLGQAVDYVQQLRDRVLDTMRQVPALNERTRERRVEFSAAYFEEAGERERLLAGFERNCIGSR